MSHRQLHIVTAALMLSLFLASMEATVVATAMPTIVAELGGLSIYAWVFSAYMLASTTAVPIFGKLSDIYGRLRIYLISVALFLIGSTLCGLAQSMPQLIAFRVIQGLGAGGLLPLAFTIIGDIFTFEQRAKIQGVFSGVWGVSSIIGPLLGGFLVDFANWQWVFFFNLIPGTIAAALMLWAWRESTPRTRAQVDFLGAALMSSSIVAFLLALFQLNQPNGLTSPVFISLLILALGLFLALIWAERRAPNPILPIHLFRERLFATAVGQGFLAGFGIFGSASFVPFFVQSVLGTSATVAGATLTPQILMWTLGSIVGSRLLLHYGYRTIALWGAGFFVIGFGLMVQVGVNTPQWFIMLNTGLMGLGMGFAIPAYLIAVQSSVPRQSLGTATSTVQFSRNIGGTIGVSAMGVILTLRLAEELRRAGVDPNSISLNSLLDKTSAAALAPSLLPLRDALAHAINSVFVIGLIASIGALLVTTLTPRGNIQSLETDRKKQASAAQPAGK
ncbi:MAG: MFS transporter [Chloroflexi bacterium]|nr:MFS transporter [Chloroflexota bacterium]